MLISSSAKLGFWGFLRMSLIRAQGNLLSRRDVLIITVSHSIVTGLAAFMSQAGQGSREVALVLQQSSTLSIFTDVTA